MAAPHKSLRAELELGRGTAIVCTGEGNPVSKCPCLNISLLARLGFSCSLRASFVLLDDEGLLSW